MLIRDVVAHGDANCGGTVQMQTNENVERKRKIGGHVPARIYFDSTKICDRVNLPSRFEMYR